MNETVNKIRSKRKRRFPVFWTCIAVCVIAVAVVLAFAIQSINDFLVEYESVQPKHVEAEVFEEYFKSIDYEKLLTAANRGNGDDISKFETKENLINYLRSLHGDKDISYYSISTGASVDKTAELDVFNIGQYFVDQFNTKGDIKYIVKAGEDKIAEFVLGHSADDAMISERGFKKYELKSIELYFFPHESVTVKLPTTSTLKINGIEVDDAYLVEGIREEHFTNSRLPDNIEGITYVAYSIDGLYEVPKIEVLDKYGDPTEIVYNKEANYYSADVNYNESLSAEYSDYVINAIEKYAAYMQMDGSRASFRPYFDTDSQLWQNIISTENYFVWEHEGYTFRNKKASEFYAYNDEMFSCRVTMTHLLHNTGKQDYVDYIDMTVYLHKVDGQYLIFDSLTHE